MIILVILDVVVACPLVLSLPFLTLNVTSLVYQPLFPFVPFIANSPTVGFVLSTLIVYFVTFTAPVLLFFVVITTSCPLVSLVISVIFRVDVTPSISFTLNLTSLTYQPFSPNVPSITSVPSVGLFLSILMLYSLVLVFPALSMVVTTTFVPVVSPITLVCVDVVLACPLVASLPSLTVSVTSDKYQSSLPFSPFIVSVPAVGAVLSTFTVYSFVLVFPALSFVVTITFVPLVSLVILAILDIVSACPLNVSFPFTTLNTTSLLYHPLFPLVPFITNSPTVGFVLSTFTV